MCVPDGASKAEAVGTEADASDASDTSSAPPAPPTLDEFAAAFLEATCQFMIDCDSTDDDQQARKLVLGDVESCIQSIEWLPLQRDVLARVEATRSGLFSYDAALGELTIQRVRAGCNLMDDAYQRLYFDDLGPEVFDGKVEPDGACNEDVECRGDAYCERPIGHCAGRCLPRPQLGQECTGDTPCGHTTNQWPLACDSEATNPVCEPTVMISNLPEGDACTVGGSLGSKSEFRMCGPHLFCSREQDGICKPLRQVGEQCFSQFDVCEGEATCEVDNPEEPEAPYFCRPLQVGRSVGSPCDERTLCNPLAGLACDAAAQECYQETNGSLGSVCNAVAPCADDLYCDDSADQCRTRLPLGSECSSSDTCGSGHCANDDSGNAFCVPRYCANEP